jgi:hypothetical protein
MAMKFLGIGLSSVKHEFSRIGLLPAHRRGKDIEMLDCRASVD